MVSGRQLFKLIDTLTAVRPTILLLPFDFLANQNSAPYIKYCTKVSVVGRIKWVAESKFSSTDNFAWMKFDKQNPNPDGPVVLPRNKFKSGGL
jgi:hypothetical protein